MKWVLGAITAIAIIVVLCGCGNKQDERVTESDITKYFEKIAPFDDANLIRADTGKNEGATGTLVYRDYSASDQTTCDLFHNYYLTLIARGFAPADEINSSAAELNIEGVNYCRYSCGFTDKNDINYVFESYAETEGEGYGRAAWTGYK